MTFLLSKNYNSYNRNFAFECFNDKLLQTSSPIIPNFYLNYNNLSNKQQKNHVITFESLFCYCFCSSWLFFVYSGLGFQQRISECFTYTVLLSGMVKKD